MNEIEGLNSTVLFQQDEIEKLQIENSKQAEIILALSKRIEKETHIYKIDENIECFVELHDSEGVYGTTKIFRCPFYLTHSEKFSPLEFRNICLNAMKDTIDEWLDEGYKGIKDKLTTYLVKKKGFSQLEYESQFNYEYNIDRW